MYKNSLIYSTRSLTGKFVQSLLQCMKVVETCSNNIDICMTTKEFSTIDKIRIESCLPDLNPIHLYFDYYFKEVNPHKGYWEDIYNEIDIECFKKYDAIFIYGGILSSASNIFRGTKRTILFPTNNDRFQINFVSVGIHLTHLLGCIKASKELGIPLYEIVYDTQEASIGDFHSDYVPEKYQKIHNYDIEDYKMKRVDMLQYFYDTEDHMFFEGETDLSQKIYDFTFGYTIITKNRAEAQDSYDNIFSKFKKTNIFAHNKLEKTSNFVDRDTYLRYIKHSKYTLVIPPYDKKSISVFRIIESIKNNCIPLIHPDCTISDIEKSYDVSFNDLIIDDSWEVFSDSKYAKVLEYLKDKFLPFRIGFDKIT